MDQFLEGILRILKEINPREEDPGLIRVGGRSKCEALDEYTLMKKRVMVSRMRQLDNGFRTARNQAISELRSLESNRASLMGEAVSLGNLEGELCCNAGHEMRCIYFLIFSRVGSVSLVAVLGRTC